MATKTKIEIIGLGSEDWTTDEDREWERYGTVEVRIDDVTYEVGAVIGVPEDLRDQIERARSGIRPHHISTWFAAASDWASAPGSDGTVGIDEELFEELENALVEAAPRLWQEHQEEAGE